MKIQKMTDKETIQLLFDIFLSIKTKNEANAQSFSILCTLEILGYYNKPSATSKNEHIRWFDNYIETLGMKPNVNEHFSDKILKDVLRYF